MPTTDPTYSYKMTLSLNVYKHLGRGLYSNVPSVLSEVSPLSDTRMRCFWSASATYHTGLSGGG